MRMVDARAGPMARTASSSVPPPAHRVIDGQREAACRRPEQHAGKHVRGPVLIERQPTLTHNRGEERGNETREWGLYESLAFEDPGNREGQGSRRSRMTTGKTLMLPTLVIAGRAPAVSDGLAQPIREECAHSGPNDRPGTRRAGTMQRDSDDCG